MTARRLDRVRDRDTVRSIAGNQGKNAPVLRFVASTGLIVSLVACAPAAQLPDLKAIYNRTSGLGDPAGERRPLVTIPGTLGSRLVDSETGRVIWGGSGSRGISADPEDPVEYRLISLPIAKGDEPLTQLRDTVRADGVLETARAEVLGVPIDINVYGEALNVLTEGGFRVQRRPAGRDARDYGIQAEVVASQARAAPSPDDFDTFQFDYDWRRDLVESAHRFGQFLEQRRRSVARQRGVSPEEVKFDLLAHSMGTLVSRYFLMYGGADTGEYGPLPEITWAGAEYFSRVVFVAPPNGGSVIALDNLINGKELGPLQPVYPATMLATHPSPYQLMPRSRHRRVFLDGEPVEDLYDPDLWVRMGWGLADPGAIDQLRLLMPDEPTDDARRTRAIAHMKRLLLRAQRFHAMLDRWAPPPAWLDLFLVVGGGFETPALANVDSETGTFLISGNEEGDGVVLRTSALLDERLDGDYTTGFRSPLRFKTTLFLPDEHVELTKNRVFADNLLFWLLEAPRPRDDLSQPRLSGVLAGVSEGASSSESAEGRLFVSGNDR